MMGLQVDGLSAGPGVQARCSVPARPLGRSPGRSGRLAGLPIGLLARPAGRRLVVRPVTGCQSFSRPGSAARPGPIGPARSLAHPH